MLGSNQRHARQPMRGASGGFPALLGTPASTARTRSTRGAQAWHRSPRCGVGPSSGCLAFLASVSRLYPARGRTRSYGIAHHDPQRVQKHVVERCRASYEQLRNFDRCRKHGSGEDGFVEGEPTETQDGPERGEEDHVADHSQQMRPVEWWGQRLNDVLEGGEAQIKSTFRRNERNDQNCGDRGK